VKELRVEVIDDDHAVQRPGPLGVVPMPHDVTATVELQELRRLDTVPGLVPGPVADDNVED